MFNEVLLTISLMILPVELPITVMEVPHHDMKSCQAAAKDLLVKVNKDLNQFGVKYRATCTRIGYNS